MPHSDAPPTIHHDLAETVARELFDSLVARGVLNDPFCPDADALLRSLTYWVSVRQQDEGVVADRYGLKGREARGVA